MQSLSEQAQITDVISGWNEKLDMNNAELSKLVPFCVLFAIFDEDPTNIGDVRIREQAVQVTLQGGLSSEPRSVWIVPLMDLTETPVSEGKINQIGGIESLTVSVSNVQLNSYSMMMRVTIPSLRDELRTNKVLRRLIIPASNWLIAYGWGSTKDSPVSIFSQGTTIDLSKANKGYFRVLEAILIRFDWQMMRNRLATGTLHFASSVGNALTYFNIANKKNKIKSLITSGDVVSKSEGRYSKMYDKGFPNTAGLKIKQVQAKSNTEKVEKSVDGYYYLGWVLEAIRQSVPEKFSFQFIDVPSTNLTVRSNADSAKNSSTLNVTNSAGIPLSVGDVNALMDNNQYDTLQTFIAEICALATKSTNRKLEIVAQVSADGKTITVGDLNTTVHLNRQNKMSIVYGSQNSLCEEASFGSRIPRELSYGIELLISSDKGASEIYSIFRRSLKNKLKDGKRNELTETEKIILKVETAEGSIETETIDTNRVNLFKKLIAGDGSQVDATSRIYAEILNNSEVPAGLAIRQYFTDMSFIIHGTAAVPPWTIVKFDGFLEGANGDYTVFQTTDQIDPKSFISTLECKLIEPSF